MITLISRRPLHGVRWFRMHHVKANIENPVRFSVSLNRDDYDALNRVADKNDVSMAWLVRKAVEKFVNSDLQRELFPDQKVREVVRS